MEEVAEKNYEEIKAKYDSAVAELEIVKEHNKTLEKETASVSSQLKSMKIALSYSDTYAMKKEIDLHGEIERLKHELNSKTEKKRRKEKILSLEISQKAKYIQELLSKVDDLYTKSENYKEELFKSQENCMELKDLLELERAARALAEENTKKALEKNSSLEKEFEEYVKKAEELKKDKEKEVQDYIRVTNEKLIEDIQSIRTQSIKEKQQFVLENTAKIEKIQKNHYSIIKNLEKFSQKNILDIKNLYESRISSLINEIDYEETKHYSEFTMYKDSVAKIFRENEDLTKTNTFLLKSVQEKTEKNSELEKIIKTIPVKTHIDYKEDSILSKMANDLLKDVQTKYEMLKRELTSEYKSALQSNLNKKDEEIQKLTRSFKSTVEKLKRNSTNSDERDKKKSEIQINYLLNRVEVLEKEKSTIEIESREKLKNLAIELEEVIFI